MCLKGQLPNFFWGNLLVISSNLFHFNFLEKGKTATPSKRRKTTLKSTWYFRLKGSPDFLGNINIYSTADAIIGWVSVFFLTWVSCFDVNVAKHRVVIILLSVINVDSKTQEFCSNYWWIQDQCSCRFSFSTEKKKNWLICVLHLLQVSQELSLHVSGVHLLTGIEDLPWLPADISWDYE